MNRITQYLPDDELFAATDFDEAKLFAFDSSNLDPTDLQNNFIRHFDPTPGQWLSEDPVGYNGGDENVTRYVGQQPEQRV